MLFSRSVRINQVGKEHKSSGGLWYALSECIPREVRGRKAGKQSAKSNSAVVRVENYFLTEHHIGSSSIFPHRIIPVRHFSVMAWRVSGLSVLRHAPAHRYIKDRSRHRDRCPRSVLYMPLCRRRRRVLSRENAL